MQPCDHGYFDTLRYSVQVSLIFTDFVLRVIRVICGSGIIATTDFTDFHGFYGTQILRYAALPFDTPAVTQGGAQYKFHRLARIL